MARVTVEDCLENVKNRFELVLISSKRARQIAQGAEPLVELENDKPTVVALREIAEGLIDAAILDEQEVESTEWDKEEEAAAELEAAELAAKMGVGTEATTTETDSSSDASAEAASTEAESEGEIDVAAALAAALAVDLGAPPVLDDSASDSKTDDSAPSEETS